MNAHQRTVICSVTILRCFVNSLGLFDTETLRAACSHFLGRGVTSLDGARSKKQLWRPHVRTRGLSEANALY